MNSEKAKSSTRSAVNFGKTQPTPSSSGISLGEWIGLPKSVTNASIDGVRSNPVRGKPIMKRSDLIREVSEESSTRFIDLTGGESKKTSVSCDSNLKY